MSETKHTPGPWTTKPETDYVPAQIWAEGRQLAEVYGESREIRARNARTMAAAPELLDALEELMMILKDVDLPTAVAAYAHAAIAKAKGE